MHKHYEMKEVLGTGAFATVKRAVKKSDKSEYAIKIIDKAKLNKEELAVIHDEVDIMQKVNHPHCVKMYELYDTKKKLYMVLEILRGGELFDRIVKRRFFSESQAAQVVQSVVAAISYLHKIGVVHRDLKPENLLYATKEDDSIIKLTDFGLAKFTKVKMATACGTPGYVAPEILSGKPYGPEVDLWSIGVILYILLCGFPPFFDENTPNLYRAIKACRFDFPSPYWDDISDPAKNLISRLLTVDPKQRATSEQVLAHPWISNKISSNISPTLADRLALMQYKRILRRGVKALIFINRFERQLRRILGKK
jgi:calcium/calmodulin-dependent protein kinase I